MKRSLIALAVLGAYAGAASAQSSVSLYGTLDVSARTVKTGDDTIHQLANNGMNSSQLVFQGREDLGGGLWAGFLLNHGLNPDTGSQTSGSKFWNRRSTISLGGGFGELRLGRDYTPTFNNFTAYDPFGTNGVGSGSNLYGSTGTLASYGSAGLFGLSGATTETRADNSVGYHLPGNLGGLFGQVMVAAGEGTPGNKLYSGRIGFAAGPFNVGLAYSKTELEGDDEHEIINLGGSFDLGVVKLAGTYSMQEADLRFLGKAKQDNWMVGATMPLGQFQIRASYGQAKIKDLGFIDSEPDSKQFALGGVYNLSKRTAIYATGSYLENEDGGSFIVQGPPNAAINEKSKGFELGLRHFF